MLVEKLKSVYGTEQPIFTNDVIRIMDGVVGKARVFQLIAEAVRRRELIRYDRGVYYLPKSSRLGLSCLDANDVVVKKYVQDDGEVFGLYGVNYFNVAMGVSYQIPNVIEVITNNEQRGVRKVNIGGRSVILRKSRLTVNSSNVKCYALLEFFTQSNLLKYLSDKSVKDKIVAYIKENSITVKQAIELSRSFPAITIKNVMLSEVFDEIA